MAWLYPGDFTNVSNFTSTLQYANYASGGSLGSLICLGLFIIVFISLKNYSTQKALPAASFITSIVCIFMFILNMITYYVLMIFVFLTVVSSIYALFAGESSGGG